MKHRHMTIKDAFTLFSESDKLCTKIQKLIYSTIIHQRIGRERIYKLQQKAQDRKNRRLFIWSEACRCEICQDLWRESVVK